MGGEGEDVSSWVSKHKLSLSFLAMSSNISLLKVYTHSEFCCELQMHVTFGLSLFFLMIKKTLTLEVKDE